MVAMRYGYVPAYGSGGYEEARMRSGSETTTSGSQTVVYLGWQPKYLVVMGDSTTAFMNVYDADKVDDKFQYAGASTYSTQVSLGGSSNYRLYSIDETGFTMNNCAGLSFYYFAIG